MSHHYPQLFESIRIRNTTLKNRFVMGSMHTGLEDSFESLPKLARFYEERALGGVSLIITGGFAPNRRGWLVPLSGKMTNQSEVRAHKELTRRVHDAGAKIALQLLHAGRYSYHPLSAAPSRIKSPITPFTPFALSSRGIESTINDFANAAYLAQQAGYDGVEIMGSEGYLINQFLSPSTNKRTDEWGGSFENRIRFACEVVKETRNKVSNDFILIFRLSLLDLVPGASTTQEMIALGKRLEQLGVDVFNTGIGWHEARVPTIATTVPRAPFSWVTKKLKENVTIPVIAANRINTPEVAQKIIADGEADMVSLARPFLADAQFVNKAGQGEADQINTCIGCNQGCLDHVFRRQRATCLVNPLACHETERVVTATRNAKKIAVVGAGPAGLAFSLVAAQRGHHVVLFDRASEIGGLFNLAKKVPGKEEFYESIRYYKRQIELHRIELRLETQVTADLIKTEHFDQVVIATGTDPRKVSVPGLQGAHVHSFAEVLEQKVTLGKTVAIVGAGGIGFDVAEFLIHQGSTLSTDRDDYLSHWGVDMSGTVSGALVERKKHAPKRKIILMQRKAGKLGAGLGKTTGWIHRASLQDAGVEMLSQVEYVSFNDGKFEIKVKGKTRILDVDDVVICAGQVSNRSLYEDLVARGMKPQIIGGAKEARELDAKLAILDGTQVALEI